MSEEIEAAADTLERNRGEFEALIRDRETFMDRARVLFSEDRFRPYRYTSADVHRAFSAVGHPPRWGRDLTEKAHKVVEAILYLADEDHRSRLSRRLLMWMPEYVSQGRYLDGWLMQYTAYKMFEAPKETNPFLSEMFGYGFDEWSEQVESQQESLMRDLGLDRSTMSKMSVDEAESWLRAQTADPEKNARMAAYYAAHPMLTDEAEAEYRELERGTLALLERDDADCLYLEPEEVAPWITEFATRMVPAAEQARRAAERGEWDDPGTSQALRSTLIEVAREMVPAIFTPERLARLVAALKAYRRKLSKSREKQAMMSAHMAYIMLERDDDASAASWLLTAICYASLHAILIAAAEERREAGAEQDSAEEEG